MSDLVDGVEFYCPCAGVVSAGRYANGTHQVRHALPLCESFEQLDADTFLIWARDTIAQHRGPEVAAALEARRARAAAELEGVL